jgi:hypothetical protein
MPNEQEQHTTRAAGCEPPTSYPTDRRPMRSEYVAYWWRVAFGGETPSWCVGARESFFPSDEAARGRAFDRVMTHVRNHQDGAADQGYVHYIVVRVDFEEKRIIVGESPSVRAGISAEAIRQAAAWEKNVKDNPPARVTSFANDWTGSNSRDSARVVPIRTEKGVSTYRVSNVGQIEHVVVHAPNDAIKLWCATCNAAQCAAVTVIANRLGDAL